ncbi:lipase family protein, partial [Pseudomonas extremaustralis]|nr:lipase family protein [Pseudomonas extremaustralis]
MNLYEPMKDEDRPFFSSKMLACPLRGHFISFQLVDEFGDGKPYAGLAYTLQDSAEQRYTGRLDADGFAKVEDCYRGPVVLHLDAEYVGSEDLYSFLMTRPSYPLPITELQVRAEQTRFFHKDGSPREHNPALKPGDEFIQVEVRDLVKHSAHLPPPIIDRKYPPEDILIRALNELRFSPAPVATFGVGLLSNRHTLLQVRPLRAFRPMLSTDNQFCALN